MYAWAMKRWKKKGEFYLELLRGITFGVRLNLKAVKNRNTLIEQSTTLIEHPS